MPVTELPPSDSFSPLSAQPDVRPGTEVGDPSDAPRPDAVTSPTPVFSSTAVLVIGALSFACLVLSVLLLSPDTAPAAEAPLPPAAGVDGPASGSDPDGEAGIPGGVAAASSFSAEPQPIPVALITRLEASSDAPLETELGHLLDAVQHGFGDESARLEPTLRSYVYRMASRFMWNPDTFRVAVTSPDPTLAAARGALVERLFDDAVEAGRLQVRSGTGPNALQVLSE